MSAFEQVRRHRRPRYTPVAPNRGGAVDPLRSDMLHPAWCGCSSCSAARAGPADRGRRGGCTALFALALAVIIGALVLAGMFVIDKASELWSATPPVVLGVGAIGISLAAAAAFDAIQGGPGLLVTFFGNPGSF